MEGDFSILILILLQVISLIVSSVFSVVKTVFTAFVSAPVPADDEYLQYIFNKTEKIIENQSLFNDIVAFGRTFSNICFTLASFLLMANMFPYFYLYQKVLISLLFSLIILTLFAYDIPRALAKPFYRKIFSACYYVYKISGWLFLPPVSLFIAIHNRLLKLSGYDERFSFLSEKELARISSKNHGSSLNNDEKEMIHRIFSLSEKSVDEIMVPRIDIRALDTGTPLQAILQFIKKEGHSRFPVFNETIDSIVGILYVKDLIGWLSENKESEWNIKQLLKKPFYVPAGKRVNDLMRDFKSTHLQIAIVVDEYGGTAGLVTMEDILEEIVGDILDECDEEEKTIIRISDKCFLVDPHINIKELNTSLGIHFEPDNSDYNTLSGLIYDKYGDVPHENASFDYGGLHITILKMDNQRIEKVKIEINSTSTEASEVSPY